MAFRLIKRKFLFFLAGILLAATGTYAQNAYVKLHLYDTSGISWDQFYISLNQQSSDSFDANDALKLSNPDLNFYTLSADNYHLSIDARPYRSAQVIPLGIQAYTLQTYIIYTELLGLPAGMHLVLHDKYLNIRQTLQLNSQYSFTITSDTASQGNNRLEILALADTAVWTGVTSNDWNTAANWSTGMVPVKNNVVSIPINSLHMPAISSGSDTVFNFNNAANDTLTIANGSALYITGNFTDNGIISGAGKVVLAGNTLQSVTGSGIVNNLMLNNIAGATIAMGSNISISSAYTNFSGNLTTNNGLTLISNINGTARIAPIIAGAIMGNVNIQQYIPGGRRDYRFFSHPFSTAIGLSQMENYIDVTGNGGSANGFTTTGSNNPSAFWYNTAAGNGSTTNDIGWTAFTNANGSGTNAWNPYEGVRILIRGAQGQGLNGNAYTPSAVTYTISGPVNQGAVSVPFIVGSSSGYNVLGNPYPSPVDIGTPVYAAKQAGNISGAGFWVWDAGQQAAGAYIIAPILNSAYNIPANTAYVINAANAGSLPFTEANKANGAGNLFKAAEANAYTRLSVYDSLGNSWDALYLSFNQNADDNLEDKDAVKMHNTAFDFYTLSADNKELSIDARPYVNGQVIPIGVQTNVQQAYIIKAEQVNVPADAQLMLHDKYLNQYQQLQQGSQYAFTITTDTASQGNNRFELGTIGIATNIAAVGSSSFQVFIVPNPASDKAVLNYTGADNKVDITVTDVTGRVVYATKAASRNGNITLPLQNLAAGCYMVITQSGNQKLVNKLVKE